MAHPGTYVNAPTLGVTGLVPGDPDTAVTFDPASDQYAIQDDTLAPQSFTAFTIGCVVKPATTGDANVPTLWGFQGLLFDGIYLAQQSDGTVEFFACDGVGTVDQFDLSSVTALSAGTTYRVIGTWDGSVARLYINGALDASVAYTDVVATAETNQFTAATNQNATTGNQSFDGTLDEVFFVADHAATAPEVAAIDAAMTGTGDVETEINALSPYIYWRLGEASGTAAADSAGGPAAPGDLPTFALSADLPTATDLTPYGREPEFNIQRGLTSPMATGMVADAGTLSTLLDNITRDLDPDNASGPFAGFLRPKVATAASVTWGATTYDLLTGRVDGWPQSYPHSGTDQVVDFRATDLILFLANTPINTSRPPELTGTRIQAVLDSIDYPGPTNIEPGLSTVYGQDLQTVAALSHLGDVAQVEYGEFGIDASGVLYFRGRPAIATDVRSTVVQSEYVQAGGLNFVDVTRGPLPLINHVTLTFGRNGRQVTVRNQDSIDAYDLQAASLSLPFETYSQARSYGKWLLFLYAEPRTEFTSVTFEPSNEPGDTFDLWADVLSRKEGDLIQITLDPLVAPYTLAGDPIVETCWIRGINYQLDQSPQRVLFAVQSTWIDGLFYWDTSELDGPDYYGL